MQMMSKASTASCFFVKRPKYLSVTSSLSVERSLVHLDRFMHSSQKVVGVTLKYLIVSRIKIKRSFRVFFLFKAISVSNMNSSTLI